MNELLKFFIEKGYLVEPKFLAKLNQDFDKNDFIKIIDSKLKTREKPIVLDEDLFLILKNNDNIPELNWLEFEKSKVHSEKGRDTKPYSNFLDILNYGLTPEKKIILNEVLKETEEPQPIKLDLKDDERVIVTQKLSSDKKRELQDFVKYFRNRYEALRNILNTRPELSDVTSITRLFNKDKNNVSIIGLVSDKRETKNGNIVLAVEDLTGKINVIINNTKKELYELAKDTLLDEVIGVAGVIRKDTIFCNNILYPDVPLNKELKKCNEEVYAVFISDVEVGSKLFFKKEFLRFIDWINGNDGNKNQIEIASKVKYLFLLGDNVAGLGIYPGQENDLEIPDIYNQYKELFSYIKKIRNDIKIIICPGNHDAIRLSEPQPVISKEIAPDLHSSDKIYLVTNPSLVNIHSSDSFPGFDVLIYHGGSFPYITENVDSIRKSGGINRLDLVMRYIFQRRHLAPSHTSTLYIPDSIKDYLVIDKIPDFFATGHMHKMVVDNYRGITMMNAGCWGNISENQEKRGMIPDPCKAFLVNLKTRDVRILSFKE